MQRTKFLWIVIPLMAITVIVLLGCGIGDQSDPVTTIRGIVTDSVTGEPIDSAVIQIGDTLRSLEFYTDSSGTYGVFAGIGYGTYRLTCRKDGYDTKQQVVRSYKGHTVITSADFRLSHK